MTLELQEFLARRVGTVVTLALDDGEIIDAKILHLDVDDHHDVTYDVMRVRVAGPRTSYKDDGAYVLPLSAVVNATDVAPE